MADLNTEAMGTTEIMNILDLAVMNILITIDIQEQILIITIKIRICKGICEEWIYNKLVHV